jgi:ribosome maturation protein SDO1
MSRKQPVTQVRLTNIAVVRYKIKGLRFEIACYPNKVLDYRKKVEKDISNVIQSTNIFSNVSKGSFARRDDLLAAFNTLDSMRILQLILEKGELQVTEKERQAEILNRTKEIVNIVAGMCVNSETKQPVSNRVIEQALKGSNFQINLTQSVKQQAMKVFRLLSQTLPIERAKMKILAACPAQYSKSIKTFLGQIETEKGIKIINIVQTPHSIEFTIIIDPGDLRQITDDIKDRTNGQGDVSVVDLQVDTEDLLLSEHISLDDPDALFTEQDSDNDEDDENGVFNGPELPNNDQFSGALELDQIGNIFGNKTARHPSSKQPLKMSSEDIEVPSDGYDDDNNNDNDNYTDSDDDISFILSKSITVIKEDDPSLSNQDSGPQQVSKMQDFGIFQRKRNNLDEIDDGYGDADDESIAVKRKLFTKGLGSFITHGDDVGDVDDADISSETDNDDHDNGKKLTKKVIHTEKLTSTSPLTQFLHTNISKALIGTRIHSLNASASVREGKSGRVVTKYDPESTPYNDFMYYFDDDGDVLDVPLLKQDHEVLQSIKRQIALQQQHAGEDLEWFYELEGETE